MENNLLYIGFDYRSSNYKNKDKSEKIIMGFATTSKLVGRRGIIFNWHNNKITPEPLLIHNNPQRGFSIVPYVIEHHLIKGIKHVVRCRDPRGFYLEIPVSVFHQFKKNDLLHNNDLIGKFQWSFKNNETSLVFVET